MFATPGPPAPSSHSSSFVYERRRPELGTLYQVVRDNLQTLYAAVEDGFASPLPAFVRSELEQYLDCGLLCRGFAWLECESCHAQKLVAFSCKGRAFCPSCMGRRMAQSAANLVDHVLPKVPLRQFVVTFPFELRARLAYDGKLLAAVTRIAIDSVLGFYKRRMRDVDHVVGHGGAVTVMQRTSSDLRLNPHLHAIVLDGVFVLDSGTPVFHPLLHLDTSDLADVLQVIRVRIVKLLERRGVMVLRPLLGVVESRHELTLLDDDFAEREPEWNLQRSGRFHGGRRSSRSEERAKRVVNRHWLNSPRRQSAACFPLDPSCVNVRPLRYAGNWVSKSRPHCQSPKWASRCMPPQPPALKTYVVERLWFVTRSGPRLLRNACTSCPTTSCALSSNVLSVTERWPLTWTRCRCCAD